MTQSPNRLSKEREAEIRDQAWAKSAYVVELLSEIDALRTENARYEDLHAEYICANAKLRKVVDVARGYQDKYEGDGSEELSAAAYADLTKALRDLDTRACVATASKNGVKKG